MGTAIASIILGFVELLFGRKLFWIFVAIGGFFLFGAATVVLIRYLGAEVAAGSGAYWLAYIIGGLIGAILIFIFLDWALIVLTSLAGAGAAARGILYVADARGGWLEGVLFVVLVAVGIAFQAWTYRGGRYRIWRRSALHLPEPRGPRCLLLDIWFSGQYGTKGEHILGTLG